MGKGKGQPAGALSPRSGGGSPRGGKGGEGWKDIGADGNLLDVPTEQLKHIMMFGDEEEKE